MFGEWRMSTTRECILWQDAHRELVLVGRCAERSMKFVLYQISSPRIRKLVDPRDLRWLDFHGGTACLVTYEILLFHIIIAIHLLFFLYLLVITGEGRGPAQTQPCTWTCEAHFRKGDDLFELWPLRCSMLKVFSSVYLYSISVCHLIF